ncbi:unnamed protein product [Periconia digitata]|uniref:Zn(2)-C6 fungal-type domain-containing protein n=1 Tax=Periconia digitata TaxID=1303443 RepID=A0A9W4UDZ4_9PLEO|nr:unnamed protein product [Periconia digitata]
MLRSSPQNTSAATRPQPKLRSACNQCCAAKVKCSGDRTGCERCVNMGTACVYQESRVGKVPGIRAKRRRIQSESEPPEALQVESEGLQAPTQIATIPDLDDQACHWTVTSQLNSSETTSDNFIELVNSTSASSSSSSSSSMDSLPAVSEADLIGTLNFDMEGIWDSPSHMPPVVMSPRAAPPARSADEPQAPTSRQEWVVKNETDMECVVQCCHLISDLESYIAADLEVFLILFPIIKKGNERLSELISAQQASRNLRCLMLFCTICYQLIALLNACHRIMTAPDGLRRTTLHIPGGGLGFSGFGYDREDELAWKAQRVLRETHQGYEAVKKIKLLAGIGPDHTTAVATPGSMERRNCFEDIEHRFNEIATLLKSL